MLDLTVGLFPYGDNGNPYQLLIRKALAQQGVETIPIPKSNFLPLAKAVRHPIQILQMYWPHSLFSGASALRTAIKRGLFHFDIKNLRKKKFVFSAENLYPHDSQRVEEDIAFTQRILNYCDGIVFTSETAREVYQEIYKLPARTVQAVVPHIHYVDSYPNLVSREEARNFLQISLDKKVILSLGRIHPYKGLTNLIRSFRKVASANECLVIAGRAKSEKIVTELRSLINSVKGAGEIKMIDQFIPDEELQYFYNASDAVAIPYDDMPINPGSIIMAMGFGKCIIAPDKGPIRELVHPSALFSYSDQEEAFPAAIMAFGDATDPGEQGQLNKQWVLKRHSPELAGKRFVDLYHTIL